MKKLFSIIFVFVFFFNTAGYFLLFFIQKTQIHKDIEAEIRHKIISGFNKQSLSLIIVSEDNFGDIHQTENGKEFEYCGEMYDIVRFEKKNGKLYFYCINDVKEKQLRANFFKVHKTRHKRVNIKNIFHIVYFSDREKKKQYDFSLPYKFTVRNYKYSSKFKDVPVPPPKKV